MPCVKKTTGRDFSVLSIYHSQGANLRKTPIKKAVLWKFTTVLVRPVQNSRLSTPGCSPTPPPPRLARLGLHFLPTMQGKAEQLVQHCWATRRALAASPVQVERRERQQRPCLALPAPPGPSPWSKSPPLRWEYTLKRFTVLPGKHPDGFGTRIFRILNHLQS